MNMKKIFAAMAATAVSASAFAAMTLTNANAAVSEIAYTQSEGSLSTDNDGKSMRRNIYNIWTQPNVTDIDTNSTVEDNITIDFTISGLNDGDSFNAWIAGSVGSNAQVWTLADAGDDAVQLNGNGNYSVTWNLAEGSESIECLILQTDINCYNYGDFSGVAGSGVDIVVNSIKTGVEDPTEAPTEAPTTTAAAETTTAAAGTTTTGATTTTKAGATTTKAANGGKTETSTNTGVAGVGVAASALALAGVAAFVARKKD